MSDQMQGQPPVTESSSNKLLAGIAVLVAAASLVAVIAAMTIDPRPGTSKQQDLAARNAEAARRIILRFGDVRRAIVEAVPGVDGAAATLSTQAAWSESVAAWDDSQIEQLLSGKDAEGKEGWTKMSSGADPKSRGGPGSLDQAAGRARKSRSDMAARLEEGKKLLDQAERLLNEAQQADRNNIEAKALMALLRTHQAWMAGTEATAIRVAAEAAQNKIVGLLDAMLTQRTRAAEQKSIDSAAIVAQLQSGKDKMPGRTQKQAELADLQKQAAELDAAIEKKSNEVASLTKQMEDLQARYTKAREEIEARTDEKSVADMDEALKLKAQADNIEDQIAVIEKGNNPGGAVKANYTAEAEVKDYTVEGGDESIQQGLNAMKAAKALLDLRIKGVQDTIALLDKQIAAAEQAGKARGEGAAAAEKEAADIAAQIGRLIEAAGARIDEAKALEKNAIEKLDQAVSASDAAVAASSADLRMYQGDSAVVAEAAKLKRRDATLQAGKAGALMLKGEIHLQSANGDIRMIETLDLVEKAASGDEMGTSARKQALSASAEESLNAAAEVARLANDAYEVAGGSAGGADYQWLYKLGQAQAKYLQAQAEQILARSGVTTQPTTRPGEEALADARRILSEDVLKGREQSPHLASAALLLQQLESMGQAGAAPSSP